MRRVSLQPTPLGASDEGEWTMTDDTTTTIEITQDEAGFLHDLVHGHVEHLKRHDRNPDAAELAMCDSLYRRLWLASGGAMPDQEALREKVTEFAKKKDRAGLRAWIATLNRLEQDEVRAILQAGITA
jgi:hypothetical protein